MTRLTFALLHRMDDSKVLSRDSNLTAREAKIIMTDTQVQDVNTFLLYQSAAARTAIYPEVGSGSITSMSYAVLGLASEVSEAVHAGGGQHSRLARKAIRAEYGDVMWYIAQIATELGTTIPECILKFHVWLPSTLTREIDRVDEANNKNQLSGGEALTGLMMISLRRSIKGGEYANTAQDTQDLAAQLFQSRLFDLQVRKTEIERGEYISQESARRAPLEGGMVLAAGNLCSILKKVIRDDEGKMSSRTRAKMMKQLGCLVMLVSARLIQNDIYLQDVLNDNVAKLADRQERNVLGGSGNER